MTQIYRYIFGTIIFNIIKSMVKQVLCWLVSIYFHVFGPMVRFMCLTPKIQIQKHIILFHKGEQWYNVL